VAGQLARYYLVKRRARAVLRDPSFELPCKGVDAHASRLEEVLAHIEDALECVEGRLGRALKPYLSLWTMLAMLALIGALIAVRPPY